MRRIFYLIQKEFRQMIRERVFIVMIFVMPIVELVLLGYAVTVDVKNVPLVVVDLDRTPYSARLVDAFKQTEVFQWQGYLSNQRQAKEWIQANKTKLALVIPLHFQRDVQQNKQPAVQLLVDGVDGNSGGVAMAYAQQIVARIQKEWARQNKNRLYLEQQSHLPQVEIRMLYNETLESVSYIVPGILALLVMLVTLFLTSMAIVREKEIGTLEQLMVTPIKPGELIVGKIVPLVVVGFILFNVGILGARLIFGVWVKGSLWSLYALNLLFIYSTLGLGIFASTVAHTQQQAMFISWFFMVFAILLSGFFIPIENMPPVLQYITYLNPVRYFIVVVRELYLKGTEIRYLWSQALAMVVFGTILLTLSILRFHKRVS